MNKKQLQILKNQKKHVLNMIHSRQSEIEELQKQFNELEKLIDTNSHSYVNVGDNRELLKNKKGSILNSRKEVVAEAAYKLVKMHGHPIKRDKLFELLEEQGLIIKGKNPHMILSTMLWRVKNSGLIRLGRGGYWLKDQRYEPLGYEPDATPSKPKESTQMDFISHISH